MKTCSFDVRIILFRFCNDVFTSNVNGSQLGCAYLLFLKLFLLLFLNFFLIFFCFIFDKLFDLRQLFLWCSHMMIRTFIWALVRLFFIFFAILFDSLVYLINLFFFIFQVRVISNDLFAFDSTFAMIRLVIPLMAGVIWILFSLFFLA